MASLSNITLSVRANIQQFQKRLQVAEKKMARFGKKASQLGSNMSQNISLPMALAGGAALKSASDFQDAVTEIEKVSSKETASKLSGQIREMAETIPMAQSEIAKLAADAARFGVQGSKNIQQFTSTVAKMSFVTDLSAQEAGRSLAKIAEQADVPMAQIDKLGSTIVRLGDSMATSQQEIVKAMSRGTIAARNFGLQGQTIAALSARINEVSESSERAGTRLRRVFQELQEPKKVEKVAEALGMTAEGFRQMRKDSPEQALLAVIKQIEKGGAAGKEMANIFATSSRAALRGLASDSGTLEEALAKASDEFSTATAMSEQFAAQKDTFSAKLQVAINKLRNTGIAIGREMMPHVLDLIKGLEGLVAGFQNLSSGTQGFIVKLGLFAGAAGPVIFAVGKLTSGVASLIPLIRSLNKTVLANPYTALAGAIAAAGAALAMYMTRTKETTKQQTALQEATEQAQNQFAKSSSEAMSLFDQLKFLNKGSDQYAKVISKINSKYGKFLDNQLSEKSNLKEIKQARKAVIDGLRQEARARAAQNKIQEIYNKQQKDEIAFAEKAAQKTDLQKGTVLETLDAFSKLSSETAKAVTSTQLLTKEQQKEVEQAGLNTKAVKELTSAGESLQDTTTTEAQRTSALELQLGLLAGQRRQNRKQVEALAQRTQKQADAQKDLNKAQGEGAGQAAPQTTGEGDGSQQQQRQQGVQIDAQAKALDIMQNQKELLSAQGKEQAARNKQIEILKTKQLDVNKGTAKYKLLQTKINQLQKEPLSKLDKQKQKITDQLKTLKMQGAQQQRLIQLQLRKAQIEKKQAGTKGEREQIQQRIAMLRESARQQRRNAMINQQAGQIIGRTMKRTTQQLTKTFSAALVGTQSLSKGMAAFGDFMQKMFQKLIQKVIQLIIKMTILKALQTAIGGVLGGGIVGGAIGGITKGLTGGMSGMFGGGGSGGGGGMNISGSLKGEDINIAGQRAQGASNRINGVGIN